MPALGVRRDKAALSSGCKSHPANAPAGSNRSSHGGNELAEAFGMRVTIYGDSASVQAAMRVNAEQSSKRSMRRPTRQPFRGRLTRMGERAKTTPMRCAGVVAAACTQGKRAQHGEALVVRVANRTPVRDRPGA